MADQVELTDLEVISRWSIAVRAATADRSELVAALEADLRWLRGGLAAPAPAKKPVKQPASQPAKPTAAAKSTAKRAAPRKSR